MSQGTASGGKNSVAIIVVIVLVVGMLLSMCICAPIGIALLLPAVQVARDSARSVASANNLKQIGLALMNYESVHGSYPPAISRDASGQPLTSWRTLILPYLEQQPLYDQFDLTQAWDAGQNAVLSDTKIPTFQSPRDFNPEAMTNYVAITGEGTAFPDDRATKIAEMADGTVNTVIVVEIANSDIHWAEPRDISIDDLQLVDEGADASGTNVIPRRAAILAADGSVLTLDGTTLAETLRQLATINGREPATLPR